MSFRLLTTLILGPALLGLVGLVGLVGPAGHAHPLADEPEKPVRPVAGRADVTRVTGQYHDLILARRLDETRALVHDDLFFIDPTADIFPGELSKGLRGADDIIALQKTWGTTPWSWERSVEFVSGNHAVAYGVLKPDATRVMPFVNILRVEDGLITERIDYGDYAGFTRTLESGQAGAGLQDVADTGRAYVAAYAAVDLDAIGGLLAEDADFQDPTTDIFGTGSEALITGRDAIVGNLRTSLVGLQDFTLEVQDAFFTPSHAVFITELSWVHPQQQGSKLFLANIRAPLVIALRIEDGKVVSHRDFWKASEFAKHLG